MASGICLFAEHYNNILDSSVAELSAVAHEIKEITGEKIQVILLAMESQPLIEQLKRLGVDEVYVYNTEKDSLFQDDANSQVIAEMLKSITPSSVLIPATVIGRSLFSRVAAKLECGLTADCTELKVDEREDGSYFIRQNKPSYGENVFVTIVTKENRYPQMMTIRPGVYKPITIADNSDVKVIHMDDISFPASRIGVTAVKPVAARADSILSAETVVVGGRGVEDNESLKLLKAFAKKIGAAIGGTRPLADVGLIAFEHQIGQTGFTIRPRICISIGVSGAIQHTEGIKDTKLCIAVNTDENAPVFNIADYGYVGDAREFMESYLTL